MTEHRANLHLVPNPTAGLADWIEEKPVSDLPPNAYQRRLATVSEAEDRFYAELATAAENEDGAS